MTHRLLLLLVSLLLLAGCAGATAADDGVATIDDGSTGTAAGSLPSPTASIDPEDARLAFSRCMREHGVDIPDPAPGGAGPRNAIRIGGDGGIKPEEFEAANEACREHLEGVFGDSGPAALSPEDQDRLVEFAACMRDHGIDMPDPQVSGNGGGFAVGSEADIDFDSPKFAAAEEACRELLPGLEGRPGQGGPAVGGTIEKVKP